MQTERNWCTVLLKEATLQLCRGCCKRVLTCLLGQPALIAAACTTPPMVCFCRTLSSRHLRISSGSLTRLVVEEVVSGSTLAWATCRLILSDPMGVMRDRWACGHGAVAPGARTLSGSRRGGWHHPPHGRRGRERCGRGLLAAGEWG
jgi:hypothetical protein